MEGPPTSLPHSSSALPGPALIDCDISCSGSDAILACGAVALILQGCKLQVRIGVGAPAAGGADGFFSLHTHWGFAFLDVMCVCVWLCARVPFFLCVYACASSQPLLPRTPFPPKIHPCRVASACCVRLALMGQQQQQPQALPLPPLQHWARSSCSALATSLAARRLLCTCQASVCTGLALRCRPPFGAQTRHSATLPRPAHDPMNPVAPSATGRACATLASCNVEGCGEEGVVVTDRASAQLMEGCSIHGCLGPGMDVSGDAQVMRGRKLAAHTPDGMG